MPREQRERGFDISVILKKDWMKDPKIFVNSVYYELYLFGMGNEASQYYQVTSLHAAGMNDKEIMDALANLFKYGKDQTDPTELLKAIKVYDALERVVWVRGLVEECNVDSRDWYRYQPDLNRFKKK